MEEKTVHPGIASMTGKFVRINRGGPESRYGRLLAVKPDHLVLQTDEEGIVYYHLDHIKSVSTDSNDLSDLATDPEDISVQFEDATNFVELLQRMKSSYVQINRGGPESIRGILTHISDDQVLLIVNREVVRIFTSHIRNISYATEKTQQEKTGSGQSASQSDHSAEERQMENATDADSQSDEDHMASAARENQEILLQHDKKKNRLKTTRKNIPQISTVYLKKVKWEARPEHNRIENCLGTYSPKYTEPRQAEDSMQSTLWISEKAKIGRKSV